MAYPDPRGSPKLPLLVAAIVASLVLACDRSQPTAPAPRAALPAPPSRDLDPDPEYTGDPNVGCWIAPDSSVFGGSTTYGGIYPYTFTRCGVPMNVWWPGFSNGVDWPLTAVFYGNDFYGFPHGHRPGFCCVQPPATGFPWTITFDKAVRNVRVYTRYVDFPGGVVRVKGAFGNLIAEKPIPVRPSSIPGRDTIAFADTNVYIVEIVPDRDPNYPPDASYPDKREFMGWQAQFEPPPCPPVGDTLIDHPDFKAKIDTLLKKTIINKSNPTMRQEWAFMGYKDFVTGAVRLGPIVYSGTACSMSLPVPIGTTTEDVEFVVHSHGHFKGENVKIACGNPSAMPYDPKANGGGSQRDWGYTTTYGRSVYAVSPEWIHKLVPNPDSVNRVNNPNRYQLQKDGCWKKKP